ncbi:MAG: creatininase family protein [Planctomycetota bacterium]
MRTGRNPSRPGRIPDAAATASGHVQAQFLRPEQILAIRQRTSLAFLPLGPLEWHGPHLPLGVDPLRAEMAAVELARVMGGVALPTLYMGTERERAPAMLRRIGFKGDEYVVGMDFPACSLRSLYCSEELFGLVLRGWLDLIHRSWGFRRIVIVNGHGGENHLAVINRLRLEYEAGGEVRVATVLPVLGFPHGDCGHATREETETLMVRYPECTDLSTLPRRGVPLQNLRWAIVDGDTFSGRRHTGTVAAVEDPRDADLRRGARIFTRTLGQLVRHLDAWLNRKSAPLPRRGRGKA